MAYFTLLGFMGLYLLVGLLYLFLVGRIVYHGPERGHQHGAGAGDAERLAPAGTPA
jgi:cytochrome bd-type quinol oxidase subunit 1